MTSCPLLLVISHLTRSPLLQSISICISISISICVCDICAHTSASLSLSLSLSFSLCTYAYMQHWMQQGNPVNILGKQSGKCIARYMEAYPNNMLPTRMRDKKEEQHCNTGMWNTNQLGLPLNPTCLDMENNQPSTDDFLLRVWVCLKIEQAPKPNGGTPGAHPLFRHLFLLISLLFWLRTSTDLRRSSNHKNVRPPRLASKEASRRTHQVLLGTTWLWGCAQS